MIQSHLNELRAVVEQATDLPEPTRAKLLQLADELERDLASPSPEAAPQPAEDAAATTSEPSGVSGLVAAIEGLETSHPEVTATVSNVARMLSKLGF